ncbi:MAG: biopolymer transporter ExbD [Deltaproteobacteria bacterium]|nr:biopolymer transporter ExbD [Deltaproteobacteria bacterium]
MRAPNGIAGDRGFVPASMAGASLPEPSSTGAKKTVDFQLNLVPFIDLLSVLISFLLMTAVWTQIAKIDVKAAPTDPAEPETPPRVVEPIGLNVVVGQMGYAVTVAGRPPADIPRRGELWDAPALEKALGALRLEFPLNEDIQITCEDNVPYEELVRVMDSALAQSLRGISVMGVDR